MLKVIQEYMKSLLLAISSRKTGLAILFLFFCFIASVIRFPFFLSTNLDEGIYLTVSSLVSQGHVLYKEVYENKPPLFFLINAILIGILGNNVLAFRAFMILLNAVAAVFLYRIIEIEVVNPLFAFLGGTIFTIFSSLPVFEIFWTMTEGYLLLFEITAIYFIISRAVGKYSHLVAGILGGCSFLVRQTALLFNGIILSTLLAKALKDRLALSWKNIVLYTLGTLVPLSVAVSYFLYHNALRDLFYWTIEEPLGFVGLTHTIGGLSASIKTQWLGDIIVISLPLIFLTIASVGFFLESNVSNRYLYLGLLGLFPLLLVSTFSLGILSGFHHEYAEFLIPLSIGSSCGSYYLWSKSKKLPRIKIVSILLLVVLCGVSIISIGPTIQRYEYEAEDLRTIESIKLYLEEECRTGKTLYVFETLWPKNSLYIYFVSNKYPPLNRLFYFPPYISREETLLLLTSLEREPTQSIVLIGPRPSLQEANNIYNYIITHYHPVVVLGSYSPYRWLPDQSITVLTRANVSKSDRIVALPVEGWKIALPENVVAKASFDQDNQTIEGEYDLLGSQKWFSLLFEFNETINAKNDETYLRTRFQALTPNVTLQVDVVDIEGNYARFEMMNLFAGDELYIPLREDLFLNQTLYFADFRSIKAIHMSIALHSEDSMTKGAFSLSAPQLVFKKS